MNDDLARTLIEHVDGDLVRLEYGDVSADDTVTLDVASTALALPAIVPVFNGQRAAVLIAGGDRVILGPVDAGWQSFTPSWTNMTTSADAWLYRYVNGMLAVKGISTVSSVSGTVTLDLPNSETSADDGAPNYGNCWFVDDNGSDAFGQCRCNPNTTVIAFYEAPDLVMNATRPHTWASGDTLSANILIAV